MINQVSATEIGAKQANELKRLLYGLYTLVKVHFAKEEEVYLPLLDANLTQDEAKSCLKPWKQRQAKQKHASWLNPRLMRINGRDKRIQ